MRYLILIYNDPAAMATMTPEQQGELYAGYMAFNQEASTRGVLKNVATDAIQLQLPNSATTVRIRDNQAMLTDGPFAETKEFLGGFYILDCKDLDEALEFAKKIPTAKSGAVEVRPVFEFQ